MPESAELLDKYVAEVRALALDDDAQRPLWRAYKRRPTLQLRLRLWNANLYKVAKIVLKAYPGADATMKLDMIQDVGLELTTAIERYRPEDAVPFGAYIHKLVRTHATRTYRKLSAPVKFAHTHGDVPVPGAAGIDEVAGLRDLGDSPEDAVAGAELAAGISDALGDLDWEERFVFEAAMRPPKRSIDEIAADTGLPRSRVQQALRRAMEAIPGSANRLAAG